MKQVLLLDFDGCVLRHTPGHSAVSNRCELYVKKHTRMTDIAKVKELNRNLYEATGHTLLGLQKLGYSANIKDFNKFVYDNIDYSLFDDIKDTNKQDITTVKKIQQICKNNEIDICIFSAAPYKWCKKILLMMDEDLDDIQILSDITERFLKPDKECYRRIEQIFRGKELCFVDDKLINILPVYSNSKWMNFLLCDRQEINHKVHVKSNLHLISNLSNLIVDEEDLLFSKYRTSISYYQRV